MVESRKLNLDEVSKLLTGKREKPDTAAKAADVFRPHSKELLDLLDEKLDSVTVAGVELFAYKRPDRDTMYIRPRSGFVPCGWFTREGLKGGK